MGCLPASWLPCSCPTSATHRGVQAELLDHAVVQRPPPQPAQQPPQVIHPAPGCRARQELRSGSGQTQLAGGEGCETRRTSREAWKQSSRAHTHRTHALDVSCPSGVQVAIGCCKRNTGGCASLAAVAAAASSAGGVLGAGLSSPGLDNSSSGSGGATILCLDTFATCKRSTRWCC